MGTSPNFLHWRGSPTANVGSNSSLTAFVRSTVGSTWQSFTIEQISFPLPSVRKEYYGFHFLSSFFKLLEENDLFYFYFFLYYWNTGNLKFHVNVWIDDPITIGRTVINGMKEFGYEVYGHDIDGRLLSKMDHAISEIMAHARGKESPYRVLTSGIILKIMF